MTALDQPASPGGEAPVVVAYVALGSNLGDALAAVVAAFDAIAALPETEVSKRSALYRTAPVAASGPDYVNAVAEVRTSLCALDLLRQLQAIEARAGRTRPWSNAPRTLDLDLLLYGDEQIALPELQVPHPRMNDRAFVLVPLAEIAPALVPAQAFAAVAGQAIEKMPQRPF
ncbi:2-amino-4-hydroxy-6-hydroxymethyldihydropteridine diphosphokinase [Xylophilus ampelinus]|uniref:2-amino-4-hydroxy-6-hydroxymethyldihydropteridine pyrophosphokinase n=1 Tax=Xylophilus ampelinus TaxID=54067 RepID=A0A318SUL3_9BURK|nr:2-amino-4-hydroxy-6-hydroxymethyldihydropteridine diphosphokinase [Xylophilus ampelinus]MCS4511702.1 2-amino-4-hydroxy-6-hydroxymethyldihydropteridine diphosphokinase [Xylophilus ampelinus]PYE73805.1 2-amino-4-hydroxy-6-hydroxymethyldihydropteridine diphosphokinase [Xylophilus ampelinus]